MMNVNAENKVTLVLVPTRFELDHLNAMGGLDGGGFDGGGMDGEGVVVAVCGFGMVAAAARTAQLIGQYRPRRILLVGIAGTYRPHGLAVGTAGCFGAVSCHGVGKGIEPRLMNPTEMGFPQWEGDGLNPPVFETLGLSKPGGLGGAALHGHLLTVTAASDSVGMGEGRLQRYGADAEDMEGFGVALAATMAGGGGDGSERGPSGGPAVAIVRGISNTVGQRDPRSWQIEPALEAARTMAVEILNSTEPWESNA